LKKRTKKLLFIAGGALFSKSFLLLFFKKEVLPFPFLPSGAAPAGM
jgi:hypothetical protein